MLAKTAYLNSIFDANQADLHELLAKNNPNLCESGKIRAPFSPFVTSLHFVKSPIS